MQQRRCSPVQRRRRCKSSSYFVLLFWRWFAALRQTMSREKLTKLVQRRKFERKKSQPAMFQEEKERSIPAFSRPRACTITKLCTVAPTEQQNKREAVGTRYSLDAPASRLCYCSLLMRQRQKNKRGHHHGCLLPEQ